MAVVWIPSLLQGLTDGAATVTVPGRTLRQVIDNLEARYPGVKERLVDTEEGRLQPEIAAAIDGDTEHLGLIQPLEEDSEIQFIPAVSGGAPDSE
ncbi:MAG TPA: MoaD/ThiS family protein [Dehalococcoidia bacterium]|nr:MoaD/ThiS family protein [Dehalococcoidia bacterium]